MEQEHIEATAPITVTLGLSQLLAATKVITDTIERSIQ